MSQPTVKRPPNNPLIQQSINPPHPRLNCLFFLVSFAPLWLFYFALKLPPKKTPPRPGPDGSSNRQRVLAQWRGVDLAPLEKMRATPARTAEAVADETSPPHQADDEFASGLNLKEWLEFIEATLTTS